MLASLITGVLLGALFWSALEYLIHGVLSHQLKTPITAIHNTHHRDPRLVLTGPIWIPMAVPLLGGMVWALGPAMGGAAAVTALAGFFRYEYVHWRIHYERPRTPRERRLWAHHLAHHHQNPRRAFGVSVRLWDRLLGTMPDPADCAKVADRPPLKHRYGFWVSLLAVHGINLTGAARR